MVRTVPGAFHAVYCHTPARWLYRDDYLSAGRGRSWREALASPAFGPLRHIDRSAAHRADLYIGNSRAVVDRIKTVYGIDAVLVPPPVDTARFTPTPRGERLLAISRLLPYKNVDVLVQAATKLSVGLDVVGDGPELRRLQALAGPSVTFHGPLSDPAVVDLMQSARAVCIAAEEDFGLVAVEAQAAGKPVIAYGRGGALETVEDGVTGILFDRLTIDAVVVAIDAVDAISLGPEEIANRADRFSVAAFRRRLTEVVSAQG
jgi:glycosyltransferase involved in cell wall biosynthesis